MHITLNGQTLDVPTGASALDVLSKYNLQATSLHLLNGFSFQDNPCLQDGDTLIARSVTEAPDEAAYDAIWEARYGQHIYQILKHSRVAICGVGGLGSHIAMSLTRLGIGELTIIDKDIVDITNLGRQAYELSDLGKPKVIALKALLHRINPFVKVTAIHDTIDAHNYDDYLIGVPYILEAFDAPENKAALTEYVITHYPNATLIGASGVSGYDEPNTVKTKQILPQYYQTGDGHSESSLGLLAPRVMLCAAHQATMFLHLLLTKEMSHDNNCTSKSNR